MIANKVVVIGGGVLGTQIGLMSAYTGHETTFFLRSEGSIGRTKAKIELYSGQMLESLEAAKKLIGNPVGQFLYPRALIEDWSTVSVEKIDELIAQGKERMEKLVHFELDVTKAFVDADIAIESMSENPELKINIYEQIRDHLPEKTLLLTNSSTLLPSQFAEHTGRPEMYCALHFANEIWKNNTAEIMGHPGTDPEVFKKVVAFAKELNMVPIEVHKEQPGYVLNSLLVPFLSAAQGLWANEVADPETIDLTWQLATGAPAGPFKILDIVGLETAYNINQMSPDANVEGSTSNKIGKLLKEKIDRGETGINTGKGFYEYEK
jgi:3-hydroxyacyl-CoA dehydrogenase